MSAKVTIDSNGQEILVLEYCLTPSELVDFSVSRYTGSGNFRRNVLITRIVVLCVTILVALPMSYWLDFRGFILALFVAVLVILASVDCLRAPKKHLRRFSKNLLKLLSKDPAVFAKRRLTITPDSIEQELENHSESSAWKGVREIVEHENAIYLRTGDWTAYIIPNRVLDEILSPERFLKIVRKFHLRAQPPVDVLPVADAVAGR
jgi:hypothetical protein